MEVQAVAPSRYADSPLQGEAGSARFVSLVFAVLLLAAAAVFGATGETSRRNLILLVFGSGGFLLAYFSRYTRLVLLFLWIISLTYNRSFFSFDALVGNNGSYGPYWIPADVFLAALFAAWAVEVVLFKQSRAPIGSRLWPWFLPFVVACCVSLFGAQSPDWSAYELLRVLKFAAVLWYTRFNFGRKEWWTAISAFAAAAVLQSTYDMFGSFRIMRLFGATADIQAAMQQLERLGPDINATVPRATGTMAHPNILAIYLILLSPLILATAAAMRRRIGILLGLAGLVGLCGLVMSMSRMAWVLLAMEIVLLTSALVVSRIVSLTRAIGVLSLGACLVMAAALPFSGQLLNRWRGDFRQSIDFRARLDRNALEIAGHAPYFGVGLSNQMLWLKKYDPVETNKFLEGSEFLRQAIPVRGVASVHNFYLMLLTETGIFGLVSFLIFVLGVLGLCVRATRQSAPEQRAAGLGLMIGIIGMLGFGMTEFGIWLDPIFFTLAIAAGLANNIPNALHDQERFSEVT